MSRYRKIFKVSLASLLLFVSFFFSNIASAADGEALFKANCASCHHPIKELTGPALKGARDREPSKTWAYQWINNTTEMVETDPYAKALKAKYGSVMTKFNLPMEDMKAILDYADNWKEPEKPVEEAAKDDNSLLFGILTLILAVIAFILLQVNSSLKKLSDEKDGVYRSEPVPFYRNKAYLLTGVIVLFCFAGYQTINGAIGLGRQKDYQPKQPIYYSHKVHAGTNQINCLYCHSGAQDSKFSNIPSVNVCMNCHKSINKYEGPDELKHEDGTPVNGTAEIQKLYAYAGWNPASKKYDKPGKPIEWVKIHSLPDHVYFNHSQHVKVGQQQCQTCHGPIQEMGEVKQFSDLSMGWCINCHRESKVNFYDKKTGSGNKFYSIYEKFHEEMADSIMGKNGKMVVNPHRIDSVTVEKIGGTECQKCHY